jgi:hypothetical protein
LVAGKGSGFGEPAFCASPRRAQAQPDLDPERLIFIDET